MRVGRREPLIMEASRLQQRTVDRFASFAGRTMVTQFLAQFAQTTGGEALFCESVAQVRPFLEQLLGRVRAQQVITVETPGDAEGRVRLRLEVDGADITYRESFDVAKQPKPKKK